MGHEEQPASLRCCGFSFAYRTHPGIRFDTSPAPPDTSGMATNPSGKKPAPKRATPKPATPKKPDPKSKGAGIVAPDWERIELDYRAGIKTLRQIAEENSISHGAVNKRAKRDGWERDLSAKINAKADLLVSKALVSKEVSRESKIAEKEVIDAAATAVADIRIAHRKDIHRARRLTNSLLDELEQQTDPITLDLLHELGDLLRSENDQGQDKRNDLYMKVISLTERSKTMKTLAESLQKLVDMERQAFNMDKDNSGNEADPLTRLLNRWSSGNNNGFKPVQVDPERPASSIGPKAMPADDEEED